MGQSRSSMISSKYNRKRPCKCSDYDGCRLIACEPRRRETQAYRVLLSIRRSCEKGDVRTVFSKGRHGHERVRRIFCGAHPLTLVPHGIRVKPGKFEHFRVGAASRSATASRGKGGRTLARRTILSARSDVRGRDRRARRRTAADRARVNRRRTTSRARAASGNRRPR